MVYDIITFGSATRDVHIKCRSFRVVEEKKFFSGKGIEISLGSKIEIDDLFFTTGGGGTNVAATFANQGFKVAWCGMVGNDLGGREILRELKALKVDTSFVKKTTKKHTNYSIVLHCPKEEERTILVYHGASSELAKSDIPWRRLKAKWFYLAPLSGKLAKLFPILVNFANSAKINLMANPGNTQLSMPLATLRNILPKLDILLLNQEEASLLLREKFCSEHQLLLKLNKFLGQGKIAVVTEGPFGAIATDGYFMYKTPVVKTKVVDRTGAGDSFGAGFLSEFIRTKDMVSALQFAVANSASCISKWGAKQGLLKKNQKFKKMKVSIKKL